MARCALASFVEAIIIIDCRRQGQTAKARGEEREKNGSASLLRSLISHVNRAHDTVHRHRRVRTDRAQRQPLRQPDDAPSGGLGGCEPARQTSPGPCRTTSSCTSRQRLGRMLSHAPINLSPAVRLRSLCAAIHLVLGMPALRTLVIFSMFLTLLTRPSSSRSVAHCVALAWKARGAAGAAARARMAGREARDREAMMCGEGRGGWWRSGSEQQRPMAMTPAASAAAVRSLCARRAASSTARWRWAAAPPCPPAPARGAPAGLPARRLADGRETRPSTGRAGVALGLRQAAGSQLSKSLAWAALG
jgi:hypothetical protein